MFIRSKASLDHFVLRKDCQLEGYHGEECSRSNIGVHTLWSLAKASRSSSTRQTISFAFAFASCSTTTIWILSCCTLKVVLVRRAVLNLHPRG